MRCEELELQAQEQEGVLREMEAAMQRLALDADRRLTQQSRDHQNNIQLLLQELQGERIWSFGLLNESAKVIFLFKVFVQRLCHKCC